MARDPARFVELDRCCVVLLTYKNKDRAAFFV
jgi:hypothetical protein